MPVEGVEQGEPGARIESLLAEVAGAGDDSPARSLVAAVLEWHAGGLARLLEIAGARADGPALVLELARDPRVASLLLLHGLHPVPDDERVRAALLAVNPALRGLGGVASVGEARDGVLSVELAVGANAGAALSRMRTLLDEALAAHAPDVAVAIVATGASEPLVPVDRLVAGAREAGALRHASRAAEGDVCETCGARLGQAHEHLFEPAARALRCACHACATAQASGPGATWKKVPPRAELLDGVRWSDEAWERLSIPIGLAFFQKSSAAAKTLAFYPSPAGAVESEVAADSWDDVVRANDGLLDLETDVEALLVHRVGGAREHYRVSIDHAYALVGLLRRHWRGLGGGSEAWGQVATFFERLRAGATAHA